MKIFVSLSLLSTLLFSDITISDAWKRVELKNSSLQAVDADLSSAELKRKSAKSMYLPAISVTGSYTHLSEPVSIDTSGLSAVFASLSIPFPNQLELSKEDVFVADLQLLWPLYTGGKIDAAQDIYKAGVDEAKALKEMKKDVEFLKLVKYYYGVVVASSLYKTREEAFKALSLHYKNAKKLKEEGQIAKIELLHAQVQKDAAKIDMTKAKHKLEIASSALKTLLKSSEAPLSPLFVNESMEDAQVYKNQTKECYAGLKIFDAKSAQSEALIKIKKSSWYPTVVAYGDLNLYKDKSSLMESFPKWFAGVMVEFNLLQRRDRSEEVEVAQLLHSKVSHLKEQALEDLKLLVEKSYKEMLSAYEEFQALSSSIDLAKENYRLRRVSFEEGLSTSVELVDAEIFLMGVETKRLNSAYDFVQKVAQLSVLSGKREMFFSIADASEEVE